MSAIGHGIAFATGAIDLPSLLGKSLGETQFKQLTVLAALGLVGTCGVTCWAVTERVLLSNPSKTGKEEGVMQVASHIWSTFLNLPPRIRAICVANFWAWIGWFPFLFYSTTWIGETYFRYDAPYNAKQSADALGEVGRVGSKAFIIVSDAASSQTNAVFGRPRESRRHLQCWEWQLLTSGASSTRLSPFSALGFCPSSSGRQMIKTIPNGPLRVSGASWRSSINTSLIC